MPWLTEPVYNRIGHFMPGTLTLFEWFAIPTAASGLAGIDVSAGYVWFTERDGYRLGRLRKVDFVSQVNEFSLPGSHPMPTDIAVAGDGCAWSAASGTNQVISWCPPYFRFTYLPIIMNGPMMPNRMRRTMNHSARDRAVVTLFLMISLFTVDMGPHVLTVQPAVAAASADPLPHVSGLGAAPASGTTKSLFACGHEDGEPPAPPPTVFGMQMYERLNSPQAALDLVRSAQVSWVRWPLGWGSVETTRDTSPDQYDWSSVDPSLEAASAAGLRVIATVDGNPFPGPRPIREDISIGPASGLLSSSWVRWLSGMMVMVETDRAWLPSRGLLGILQ